MDARPDWSQFTGEEIMRRNPGEPQRPTEANRLRTIKRIEQYNGVTALLATWEAQPDEVQSNNHDYIVQLRAKVRTVRNYLLNRNDPTIRI